MDNQKDGFDGLLSDIQKHIALCFTIEHASNENYKSIFEKSLINKNWYQFIQCACQKMLDSYFPYCKDPSHYFYSLRKTAPLKLLAKIFENLKDRFPTINIKVILDLINIDNTIQTINEKFKKDKSFQKNLELNLYALAIANGHNHSVMSKLTKENQEITQNIAFEFSARNGHLHVIKNLYHTNIPENIRTWAITLAVQNGHFPVVEYLFPILEDKISIIDYSKIFQEAAAKGHLNIVQYFARMKDKSILDENKKYALIYATVNAHIPVIEYLLDIVKDKNKLLIYALSSENIKVIDYVLNNPKINLSIEDKESAFKYAIHQNKPAIFKYLIEIIGEELSIALKKEWLQYLLNLKQLDIANILTEHLFGLTKSMPDEKDYINTNLIQPLLPFLRQFEQKNGAPSNQPEIFKNQNIKHKKNI